MLTSIQKQKLNTIKNHIKDHEVVGVKNLFLARDYMIGRYKKTLNNYFLGRALAADALLAAKGYKKLSFK